ncbi:hypothetical protein [Arcobacter arenosus]|uniref:Uncharacterized protein n=1 Tax=Arcobacter arenosus TaxID=2576037 RepID=A0A5R8XXH8_9BACT|nr:hypothetical protein [Arcobacter arenosus]TLP35869.1 hypothetical protein FDK22_14550 [Arcobacter arenosus]
MKNTVNLIGLESQVLECYSYFMDNHKTTNFDDLEAKIRDLKNVMVRMTITNLVNMIDRVVEDGRKNRNGENKQYNVSSLQITNDDKVNLICHEVVGFDNIDKKYILDNELSYINFSKVTRVY